MEKVYIANRIVQKNHSTSGSTKRKYNLSSYFLAHIIDYNLYKNTNFINSYLYYSDLDNINCLYVLTNKEFTKNYKSYISHVKLENNNFLYTFDISKFNKDVQLFIEGKYSKFSQELKDIICPKNINNIMLTDIYKILYRTQDKRERIEEMIGQKLHKDAEVCSIINKEDEIYKPN